MCADVVGRDAELRTITRFLDSLIAQPQALVLEGEPGIGKTTLWLAALDQARQRGFRVLSCRPSAAEAHLSYASLADVLRTSAMRCWRSCRNPNGGRSTSSCFGPKPGPRSRITARPAPRCCRSWTGSRTKCCARS